MTRRGPETRSTIELGLPSGPWYDNPDEWDTLNLGADTWPGIATVEVTRSQKWDDAEAKGAHGADPKYQGRGTAKVKITVKVWDTEQFELLEELVARIEPEPGGETPGPLDLSHPVARFRRVKQVKIDSIDGPEQEESGLWSVSINATEYSPIEEKGASGIGGGAGGGGLTTDCLTLHIQRTSKDEEIRAKERDIRAATLFASDPPTELDLQIINGHQAAMAQLLNEYLTICAQMEQQQCEKPPSGDNETLTPPPMIAA